MELKKGTLLQGGKFKIEQTLGQGSFGITYLATAKLSTQGNLGKMDVLAKVAIKEFFMSDINGRKEDGSTVEGSTGSIFSNYKKRFRKEAENLSKLIHPNIVKVFDVFDENNTTYYVMEYLSDTNLNKYIKNKNGLSEKECIVLTEEIGGALQYMHDSLMLHLDLKPGNIMLRNNEAVLIDFGLSKQFNVNGQPETSTTIGQGTQGYAPLEQQNYNGSQSKGLPFAMDVYALGGTMFKMITGQTPPDASSIFNDGFPRKELANHNISTRLANIIEKAMAPSKKERYKTVSELLSDLNTNIIESEKHQILDIKSIKADFKKSGERTEIIQSDNQEINKTKGKSDKDNTSANHNEIVTKNKITSFISDCLELIWHPLYLPVVSLTILLFFCDFCGWETSYFDPFVVIAISMLIIINISSYICDHSGNKQTRHIWAICALICLILFGTEIILLCFPQTCQRLYSLIFT